MRAFFGLASTPIGATLRGSPLRVALALVAGAVGVASMFRWLRPDDPARHALVLAALLAALIALAGDPAPTLGLRARPEPRVRYWIVATLLIGAAIAAVLAAFGALLYLLGESPLESVPPMIRSLDDVGPLLWRSCVNAPVLEEVAFRVLLCAPLVAIAGRWVAIAASGVLFAYYHVHWGVGSPENMLAGFVFAWAYLRSGTVVVPIALHALGNLCVVLAHLAHYWYAGRP